MTKLILIAASLFGVAAGPALAREARPATTDTGQMSAPHAAQAEQRYCVAELMTGSRIPYRTCQTRADWMKQGFDPLAKAR